MKAVVMAGGLGSRLRPLTIGCPKPMVPLVNKPVLAHILNLLKHHHISEVVIAVHHLAGQIQAYFGDGRCLDIGTVIDSEARVNRSIIGPNCFIGPALEVHQSIIGPQSNLVATPFIWGQTGLAENAAPGPVAAHPLLASQGWPRCRWPG